MAASLKAGMATRIIQAINPLQMASSADTSVTIPVIVNIKGVSYKVTRDEDKAFQNWKNLRMVHRKNWQKGISGRRKALEDYD